ncbi:hypothetical protein [Rhizobium sp. YS-1r]|uniref:hypothetical protein n=1 Tax=Rhizobium sp. YS-1r TaxID=1532558 RepID=UPI00050F252F|nr:hypothetical protein [Rhizobium sp. YS-1r]KGD87643.1 hypothetical protein JL39_25700 [Rhizobium sp. YS-1r]
MLDSQMNTIRNAIGSYVEMKARPPLERISSDPFEIDIALCCVTLGDVSALAIWIDRLEKALSVTPSVPGWELLDALKQLLSQWRRFEQMTGSGALLDYEHCLKSSPARVIGLDRIANAAALQKTRSRVPADPYWALQWGTA